MTSQEQSHCGGRRAPTPGSPLEAKGMEEERGERRKKKREHEEGAPLVLRLAPPLWRVAWCEEWAFMLVDR